MLRTQAVAHTVGLRTGVRQWRWRRDVVQNARA
jgi:hypothetical protein